MKLDGISDVRLKGATMTVRFEFEKNAWTGDSLCSDLR